MDTVVTKAYRLLLIGSYLEAKELVEGLEPESLKPQLASLRALILADDDSVGDIGLSVVEALHTNDKIEEAYELLTYLRSRSPLASNYVRLNELLELNAEINQIMNEYDDVHGWTSEKSGDIRVSYKRVEGTPTISVKTEGVLDVPIFNLLALIYEIDLYNTWMPFCSEAGIIASLSPTRRVMYQKFSLPVISDRECVLVGSGFNLIRTRNCIFVSGKSCHESGSYNGTKIPPAKGVRAKVNFFGACFRPLDRGHVEMKLISNMDPMLSLVPYSVFNFLLRKFASTVFTTVAAHARNLSPQVRRRIVEGSEFYSYLASSLEEFYDRD
jgi:hypothetical protein